jgi:hypothetical protein
MEYMKYSNGGGSLKKTGTITLVALIVVALFIPQSLAVTNQGFFYRVEDGDRFYFTLDSYDEGVSAPTEIIYIEIMDSSVSIPDPVTHLGDFSYLDIDINFENGTSIGLLALQFIFASQLEYPVGNWSMISTLAETDLEDVLFFEAREISILTNEDLWGYSYKTNSSNDTEHLITVKYSKFDGILHYYNYQYWNTTTEEMLYNWEVSRFSFHNLRWGFNDGDRFDFHLVLTGNSMGFTDLDESFYLEIFDDGLPNIPYNMTEWDDIPFALGQQHWGNGTITYDSFLHYSWRIAVPIGNWSLLDTFIEDRSSTVNVTLDDPDPWFWGYSWNETSGETLFEVHTDYLKIDGFVARHFVSITNTTSSEVGTISLERTNLEPYTDRTAPEVNHPDDMEFVVGTENQSITWIPTDENPTTYEISVNGTTVDSGSWTSGSLIALELANFTVGEYTCTITLHDIGGNHVTDSVQVTVTSGGPGIPDIIMNNLLYIALGVGLVIVLALFVFMRRRS